MPSTSATLAQLATDAGIPLWLFLAVVVWTLAWKGIAWWRAARKGHVLWFIAFFLIHTFGILEILYVFLFAKMKLPVLPSEKKRTSRRKK